MQFFHIVNKFLNLIILEMKRDKQNSYLDLLFGIKKNVYFLFLTSSQDINANR